MHSYAHIISPPKAGDFVTKRTQKMRQWPNLFKKLVYKCVECKDKKRNLQLDKQKLAYRTATQRSAH